MRAIVACDFAAAGFGKNFLRAKFENESRRVEQVLPGNGLHVRYNEDTICNFRCN